MSEGGERGEVRGRLRWEGGKEGERGRLAGDGGEGSLYVHSKKEKKTSAQFTFNARPALPGTSRRFAAAAPDGNQDGSSFSGAKVATVNSWDVRTSKSCSVMKPR